MPEKDQLEALKKLNARARSVTSGAQNALPEAGKPLQAGSAADLQANVGNAGLNQMIGHEAGQNDVSRMGPNELAAHAKKAGDKVAKQRGDGPKANAKKAEGRDDGKKQKEAAALEKEAQRHKADAAREKKVATDKKAVKKGVAPAAKAVAKKNEAAPGKGSKKGGKTPDDKQKAAGSAKGKPKKEDALTARTGDKKKVAEAKERAGEKGGKKGAKATAKADHGEASAADKKAKAKSVRAEATQAKAQVAKKEVGKAAEGKGGEAGDPSKQTLAVHKEKKAVKADIDAEHADKKVLDKKKSKTAGLAAKEPSLKGDKDEKRSKDTVKKGSGAKADGQEGKDKSLDTQKDAKVLAAATTTQSRTQEADEAAKKLVKVEDEKVKAEGKVEASPDADAKASHATEAEAKAKEEEAAGNVAAQKLAAEEKARLEEESPASEATLKEISRASELDSVDGERITLVGTYVPRPAPGGSQMLGHVSILVGNHEVRLGVETRGTAELLRLSGERIAVTGTLDLKKASSGQSVASGKPESKTEKPLLGRPGTVARR